MTQAEPIASLYFKAYGLYKGIKANMFAIRNGILQANAQGSLGANQQFDGMAPNDIDKQLRFHLKRFKQLRNLTGMWDFLKSIVKKTGKLDAAKFRRKRLSEGDFFNGPPPNTS